METVSGSTPSNARNYLLMCCQGVSHGSYVLRSLATSEFKYDSAREKLLNLRIESQEQERMIFASVVDEQADEHDGQNRSMLGSLMRLGTSVNLESQLSVSSQSFSLPLVVLTVK